VNFSTATETAVRMRSVKEAVAKAFDITLAAAWQRIQGYAVDPYGSRFWIDGKDAGSAVYDKEGRHVFTIL
jgi:hypothetical protein